MARPARGSYPCKVCPDVLESPGALGGHMSGHRRRGELVDPVIVGDPRLDVTIFRHEGLLACATPAWTWRIEPCGWIGYDITFTEPPDPSSPKGAFPVTWRHFVFGTQRRAIRVAERGAARRTRRDERRRRLSATS